MQQFKYVCKRLVSKVSPHESEGFFCHQFESKFLITLAFELLMAECLPA
jgi:hypothetical protein